MAKEKFTPEMFLKTYSMNNDKFTETLTEWLKTSANKDDPESYQNSYQTYRLILKKLFPGSGLIYGENKKDGTKKQVATYVGSDDEEGQKEFKMYTNVSRHLAEAKGLEVPQIVVSKELGKIFAGGKSAKDAFGYGTTQ